MPAPQIQNPHGAFGLAALDTYDGTERSPVVENFRAAVTTIIQGDLVALSTSSGYVIRALTDTAAGLVIGVALHDGPSTVGNPVPVIIYGPAYGVRKDNTVAVTAGNLVVRSAAVTASALALAGTTAVTQLKDTGTTIGIVMASKTAGDTTCDLFVVKT